MSARKEEPRGRAFVESSEFFAVVLEALALDRRVAFTPRGRSMLPTLRDGVDVAYLERATSPAKYDVALYRRGSGQYVLHRIVVVESDGTFTMCGDGQTTLERGVRRDQIFATVVAFRRGRREVDCARSRRYRLYSRFWVGIRPLRAFYFRWRGRASRVARLIWRRGGTLRGRESRRL